MMDWSPLTDDGQDPVPGQPDEVNHIQAMWRQLADNVERSDVTVQHLDTAASWKGEAATAFAGHLGGLKEDLPRLARSMGKAAWGLWVYEGQLFEAQGQARRALDIAIEAHAQIGRASSASLPQRRTRIQPHTMLRCARGRNSSTQRTR
jgi:uncharacterized protein (DUF2236 family)